MTELISNKIQEQNDNKKPTNINITSDYDKLVNFVNNRTKMLCEIYINNFKMNGFGSLVIYLKDVDNVNVEYVSWDKLGINLQKEIIDRKKVNSNNIIYFILIHSEKNNNNEINENNENGKDNKNNNQEINKTETIVELDVRNFIN